MNRIVLDLIPITNVVKMDDTLKHAIAVRLAAELALAVTGDSGKEGFLIE